MQTTTITMVSIIFLSEIKIVYKNIGQIIMECNLH